LEKSFAGRGWAEMMDNEFEKLRKRKIELKNDLHKDDALDFNYCLSHVIEEFGELIVAVKEWRKRPNEIDRITVAEELADLANCCEFTFIALKGEGE
jgi:NTP pyrophosphatase (non-canonical NTP hydrolase)